MLKKELEAELEKARTIMVDLIEIADIYSPLSECIPEAKQFVMGSEKAYKDAVSNLYNWQKQWKFLKMLKNKIIAKEDLKKYHEEILKTKRINWTNFSDEMPKENQWYLVAMVNTIPMLGYIKIESKSGKKVYSFEYYHGDRKCTIFFDEKHHSGLFAWFLDKDLF